RVAHRPDAPSERGARIAPCEAYASARMSRSRSERSGLDAPATAAVTSAWLSRAVPFPAAQFVMQEIAATGRRIDAASEASAAVDMQTASAPIRSSIAISDGVS